MEYATDEERVEEIKKWWKENGKSVILGIALGLSILFGWRWWTDYQLNQSLQASTLYNQLQLAVQENKNDEAVALNKQLSSQYQGQTYAVYAALLMAKSAIDNKDSDSAKASLQWALTHADGSELQHLVRIRLARLLVAENALDEAWKLVNAVATGPFAAAYEELKGDIEARRGNMAEALAAYNRAAGQTPPGGRSNPALQYKIEDLAQAK